MSGKGSVPRKVAYIWSPTLQHVADQLPANIGRSSMVHALIVALDLLTEIREVELSRALITPPDPALCGPEQLRRYHSSAYVGPFDELDQADDRLPTRPIVRQRIGRLGC
jgi:hypothetical protein